MLGSFSFFTFLRSLKYSFRLFLEGGDALSGLCWGGVPFPTPSTASPAHLGGAWGAKGMLREQQAPS